MHPTIDILMAVYNNTEYILPQLQSIIKQTYPHFRIIIRDDCSSDHSINLIENFSKQHPNKIHLIKGTKNLGPSGNFSALMNESKAPYIMFCDADDVWLPTKIEESLALMQKKEAIYGKETPLLIHTDLTVVNQHLHTLSDSFWKYSKIHPHSAHSLNRLLIENVITGCTMLINKYLLQLAAPIPKDALMHDWWLGLVASAFGKIDFLPKSTILYRQHSQNSIGAKNWKSIATYWKHAKKALYSSGRQEIRQRLIKTMHQAAHFLHRYRTHLSPEQQHIIHDYAHLPQANAFQKRYLFLKHRYFKNSFAKNIGSFFLL